MTVHCYDHGGYTLSLRQTTQTGGIIGVCFTAHGLSPDTEEIPRIKKSEMREPDTLR